MALTEFVLSFPPGDFVATRFVDDILICAKQEPLINHVRDLGVVTCPELVFTTEDPGRSVGV